MRAQPGTHRMIPILAAMALAGCSNGGGGSGSAPLAPTAQSLAANPIETRVIIPFAASNFTRGVQNPLFPLVPGTTYTYRHETPDGVETNTVEVTHDTKMIAGVTTVVIHDRVYLEGDLTEDTFDWYANDKDGNVWYFGEDTKTVQGGVVVSTEGSWEAGKGNAKPGVIMLAHPHMGDVYQQENAPGVVADMARVKGLNETATVPYGVFNGCLKTQEWTPLEPGNRANKFYAPGIGTVLEVENRNGGRVELVSLTRP